MNTQELATRLIDLCRQGKNLDAIEELYDDDVISMEPPGSQHQRTEGKSDVLKKNEQFFGSITEVHSNEISEPIISGNQFACKAKLEITSSEFGRLKMEEIAVYGVKDGKIVWEHFYFDI